MNFFVNLVNHLSDFFDVISKLIFKVDEVDFQFFPLGTWVDETMDITHH